QIPRDPLGGCPHPHGAGGESMEVPRRSIQFVEVAELTLAALVCEDLAQSDDLAELIRSVGTAIVLTALLCGGGWRRPPGGAVAHRYGVAGAIRSACSGDRVDAAS